MTVVKHLGSASIEEIYRFTLGSSRALGRSTSLAIKISNFFCNVLLVMLIAAGAVSFSPHISTYAVSWFVSGVAILYILARLCGGALKNRLPLLLLSSIITASLLTLAVLHQFGMPPRLFFSGALMTIACIHPLFSLALMLRLISEQQERKRDTRDDKSELFKS